MTTSQTPQPWPGTAEALRGAIWQRSSYSGTQGNCVEVATNLAGIVAIRDSKDAGGAVLIVTAEEWRGFIADVREHQLR